MRSKAGHAKTEQRILDAARKVFQARGFHGARMQDIADRADLNKALLHYYFRNKAQLFEGVLQEAMKDLLPTVSGLWSADLPLEEKIRRFINGYLEVLAAKPYLPVFVFHEVHLDINRFHQYFLDNGNAIEIGKFLEQIRSESKAGRILPVDPRQVVINMLSLCIFPFIARPLIMKMMNMKEKEFRVFAEQRGKLITDMILQSIKK